MFMQLNFHGKRNTDSVFDIRTSRGFVKDTYDPASAVREPLTGYREMLELIRRDPAIATAFDILVDFSTYRGYDFINGSKNQIKPC